jgi:hypothetical protein
MEGNLRGALSRSTVMRKHFRNQAGRIYEPYILLVFLGLTAAVAIPAFMEGKNLRGSLCLVLAATPFLYLGWQHFQAWREEKNAPPPTDPPSA